MASTRLMASSTSRNSDLRRRSSSSSSTKSSTMSNLHIDDHQQHSAHGDNLGSVTAEITLLDAAGAVTAISDNDGGPPTIRRQESVSNSRTKTAEDVWKEIVSGKTVRREFKQEEPDEMMTLEDFLAKAEAVDEEDVKSEPMLRTISGERLSGGVFPYDHPFPSGSFSMQSVDGGRGKRRALLEPLDKAAQQRQRRMIKNRESAARSRERKQAYQIELESLAVKLEEEHEQLLKEKAERIKERRKQLMEKIIPVVEKRRPKRVLRRVQSTEW